MFRETQPMFVALLLVLGACGDDGIDAAPDSHEGHDSGAQGETGGTGGEGEPEATPLMFTGELTMGTVVPPKHMCGSPIGGGTGENISPPLEWTGGPDDTMSFALVLYDVTFNVLHWVVWDIPATTTSLPEGIENGFDIAEPSGAHHAAGGGGAGYFGPCSSGPSAGTYAHRLYALDRPSLGLGPDASGADAQKAIEDAMLEMTVWEGTPE